MVKKDYIKTINVNGINVDLGMDDYGQCYYIEWSENGKKKESVGLGTYNSQYMEEIYYLFDENYKKLSKKKFFGEGLTPEENEAYNKYIELFDKEYSNVR